MNLLRKISNIYISLILMSFSLQQCNHVNAFGSDDTEQNGLHLGSFNTYSHQVIGDVYAVDQYTLLIKDFQYDGLGKDTFFWAGSTVRPSNVGFIVPDEDGKTNKLPRYTGKDITLRLPDNKKLTSIKWFCVWDFREHSNYGDIYISEGFEPPAPQQLAELSKLGKGVKSKNVLILDSKTLLIPEFYFDGNVSDTYFWVGAGSSPDSNGEKVPDERGYLNALAQYDGDDIVLELPGKKTFFDINWFSIYNVRESRNYGSILIPGGLNIPPALVSVMDYDASLPNCEQLHKNLQLSWEVFGPQITFQLSGLIDEDDYMSFGTSGSPNSTQMIDGDAVVVYMVGHSGFVVDYNLTAKYPCSNVAGPYKGVCPDPKLGGVENYQFQTAARTNGVTSVTFRRQQDNAGDHGDKIFDKEEMTFLIWAVGKYNVQFEPGFHYMYPKGDTKVVFGRKPAKKNCYPFTKRQNELKIEPWKHFELKDPSVKTFLFHLGPSGLKKGYTGISGLSSPGVVFYVNGAMTPNIYVKRGVKYQLRVEAGNNGFNAAAYNPLYISDDPHGGYSKMTEEERKKVTIYAGIKFDSKGRPQPIAAGRLCMWEHTNKTDRRRDDEFKNLVKYRDSLKMHCEKGEPALLDWTPDEYTPDVLYYQSYTQRNMGWKIFVVDELVSGANVLNVNLAILFCSIFGLKYLV